jgi:ATP-dependent Clp protease adapter protein ClpS
MISWFRPSSGRILPADASLLQLRGFAPRGFVNGIEILNDNTTPMAFVVEILQKHIPLDKRSAIRKMLFIHYKGGLLLPVESRELAKHIAASITAEAREHNHQLVCRAVSVI